MQLVNHFQKILILAVVSLSFLMVWYGNRSVVPSLVPQEIAVIPELEVETPKPIPVIKPIQIQQETVKKSNADTNSVWNRLINDFELDHRAQSSQVQAEIRKLLAEKGKFNQVLQAAGPYLYYIMEQTKTLGLPAEMALIPVIESEFNPHNRSHKGALGLWQLMRGTANILGVNVTSGYDGRRNVIFSTRAALIYLNDLGKYFKGNWYLALAAYNTGQGNVSSSIRKTGSRNFWNLPLSKETRFYVPRLLAVAAIIKNPDKYGVKLPHIDNSPYFTELKLKKAVSLEKLGKSTDIKLETLHVLNPDYKHGSVVPKKGAYTLLVPVEKASAVKTHLSDSLI